jgi:hypothetical protein
MDSSSSIPADISAVHNQFTSAVADTLMMLKIATEGVATAEIRLLSAQSLRKTTVEHLEPSSQFLVTQDAHIKARQRELEYAKREQLAGFPRIISLTLVATWSFLEAYVEDIAILVLQSCPERLDTPELLKATEKRHTQSEGDVALSVESILETAVHQRSRKLNTAFSKLEYRLELVGIKEYMPATTRRELTELGELRNLIVHRGTEVDRRFLDKCSWVNLAIGEFYPITIDTLTQFTNSLITMATRTSHQAIAQALS